MNLEHPLAQQWTPDVKAAYLRFSEKLMQDTPLDIKIGKGGLSYYKGAVFVCHFNAKPQSKRDDLGFADFRFDALKDKLDVEATSKLMQQYASPEIEIKVNKLWCSFHFPLTSLDTAADLFIRHIICKAGLLQSCSLNCQ